MGYKRCYRCYGRGRVNNYSVLVFSHYLNDIKDDAWLLLRYSHSRLPQTATSLLHCSQPSIFSYVYWLYSLVLRAIRLSRELDASEKRKTWLDRGVKIEKNTPPPPRARKPPARFALEFSFLCVNREVVNSLPLCSGHFFRTRQKVGHAFTPILTSVCKTPTSTLRQWQPEHFPGGKIPQDNNPSTNNQVPVV